VLDDNIIKTDWCAQIRNLAERMCPCKHDELLFHAIQLVPHAVSRNSFFVRKQRAKSLLKVFCVIDGDICISRPRRTRRSCMQNCVEEMKAHGISNPLDHMRPSSAATYRPILQKLGWIAVQPNGRWQWTGPPDADYRTAVRANHTRSKEPTE